ncbi:MAG: ribokinase [Fimbriimonas sp.]
MKLGGVTIVGSANMDFVVRTSHFPRPGETVLGGEFVPRAGGRGANQAVAVGKLGGRARLVAKVGGDGFAHELLRSLRTFGVDTGSVVVDPTLTTGAAFVTLNSEGDSMTVVAPGANRRLHPDEVQDALSEGIPTVLLTEFEVPVEAVANAVGSVPNDCLVISRPPPAGPLPDDLLPRIDYLVANAVETELRTGILPIDDETCLAAGRKVLDEGARNVVITLGDQGSFLVTPQGGRHFSTLNVWSVDPSGAGDAFTGALAQFLAEGRPIEQSIYLANAAGAMTTLKEGTQRAMPTLRELRDQVGELF